MYHFETSTTKNLFDNCCYLYISMILVILEVVFQVFLRLLRVPQYSNQWACETGKHLHELSLYAHAMDYCLCRCYVCLFHDIVSFSKSYYFSFAVWWRLLYRRVFEVSVKVIHSFEYFTEKGRHQFS